jgi:hypothetical protein
MLQILAGEDWDFCGLPIGITVSWPKGIPFVDRFGDEEGVKRWAKSELERLRRTDEEEPFTIMFPQPSR